MTDLSVETMDWAAYAGALEARDENNEPPVTAHSNAENDTKRADSVTRVKKMPE